MSLQFNDLWALFFSAFISATLAPGGSEALLALLAVKHGHSAIALLSIATLGNTLGAVTTWGLGWLAGRSQRFDAWHKTQRHGKALQWIKRWGPFALLLSWLPLIGDGLCFAAGGLKLRFLPCLVAMLLGKLARYAAILIAVRQVA